MQVGFRGAVGATANIRERRSVAQRDRRRVVLRMRSDRLARELEFVVRDLIHSFLEVQLYVLQMFRILRKKASLCRTRADRLALLWVLRYGGRPRRLLSQF